MEELIELVMLIHKTKFKSSGMLNLVLESGSQMDLLFQAIASGRVQADEDIARELSGLSLSKGNINTLKSKLKERLLNTILLLDLKYSNNADRRTVYADCSRKWASAMVLMSKNAKTNAVALLENLLKETIQYEFTQLSVNILQELSLHYGLIEGDIRRHEETEKQIETFEEVLELERLTEKQYVELVKEFVRRKGQKQALTAKAADLLEQVKPAMKLTGAYKVQFFGRLIELAYYDSVEDYKTHALKAEEGLRYFQQKNYNSNTALQAFHYHLVVSEYYLKNCKACSELIQEFDYLYEKGSFNWFKLQEMRVLSAFHCGHFEEAQTAAHAVLNYPRLRQQPQPIIEFWKIIEAFIAFLTALNWLESDPTLPKFRLAKFMNEVKMFAQDKSGMNIPVLVVQFLHYLAAGEYELCESRVDALAKYRQRYLKDESSKRNEIFIRMLELIPKAAFLPDEIQSKAAPMHQELLNSAREVEHQNHEIEVIPYHQLWEIIIQALNKE